MTMHVQSPFLFNTHDLPRRAGEQRRYQFSIRAPERVGLAILAVPALDEMEIELSIESVTEGVLARGHVTAIAVGECIRCLEPIDFPIEEPFQELYRYPTASSISRSSVQDDFDDDDDEALLSMEGDLIDLQPPITDAIVLNLPINPLCDAQCEGLCPECGEKWVNLPSDHRHELIDPRWGGLAGWTGSER